MPAGGDKLLISDYSSVASASLTKPLVRLIQTVAQNVVSSAVSSTALTFTTETIDTDGFFNSGTSTTRITPNKAGYYRVRGVMHWPGATNQSYVILFVRKNGTTAQPPAGRLGGSAFMGNAGAAAAAQAAVETECILDFNGTTDYVELIAQQVNQTTTTLATNVAAPFSPVFEVEYLRGL